MSDQPDHSDRKKPQRRPSSISPRLRTLVKEELGVIRMLEQRLTRDRRKVETLEASIKRDEELLATLRAGLDDAMQRREIGITPSGRLTRTAAAEVKERVGLAVYDFLRARRGKRYSRADIEAHLPPNCRYPWHKVMAYWATAHDQTPILHDGNATSARLYWV